MVRALGVILLLATCAPRERAPMAAPRGAARATRAAASREGPSAPPLLQPIAETLAASSGRTCAIVGAERRVACWGVPFEPVGAIEPGAPRRPELVPGLADVVAVAVGEEHACALGVDGRVRCWGSNAHGALGTTGVTSSADPLEVPGIVDAVQVACGAAHTCALRATGQALCWGDDERGQVGTGPEPARQSTAATARPGEAAIDEEPDPCSSIPRCRNASRAPAGPLVLAPTSAGVPDVVELGAGAEHTCARTRAGQVWCWGALFDPTQRHPAARAVRGLPPARRLFAGWRSAGSIAEDGRVFVWGVDPRSGTSSGTPEAVEVPEARGAVELRFSPRLVARFPDGRVSCQGDSRLGGCGVIVPESEAPLGELQPSRTLATGATAIAAGTSHVCAVLRGGGVRCWGADGVGQLGDAPVVGPQPRPVRVPGLGRARSIAVGESHACAIVDDGTWCWGPNHTGALGVGRDTPWSPRPLEVPGATDAREIAASGSRTLVARASGDVDGWGTNWLCVRHRAPGNWASWTPARSPLGPARRLAVGDGVECAASGGSVRCLGAISRGAVGAPRCQAEPGRMELPLPVSQFGRGVQACAAVGRRDVACWGGVIAFRHPLPSADVRTLPVPARTISTDLFDGCACMADGRAACFHLSDARPPEVLAGIQDCVDVARSIGTLCVLRRDRTVWCVGGNDLGTLGDGTLIGHDVAAPVVGLRDVVQLEAGASHFCARTADGAVSCWGDRGLGQLGDGTGGGIRPEGRDVALP